MAHEVSEAGLPESNNCYGQLTALSGLAVVADLFVTPGGRTRRRVSGYSGAEELELDGPGLELESHPHEGHRHFIGGRVEPSARGRASLRLVSARLAEAGVAHQLELYFPETSTLLDSHEYGWSGSESPVARRGNVLSVSPSDAHRGVELGHEAPICGEVVGGFESRWDTRARRRGPGERRFRSRG